MKAAHFSEDTRDFLGLLAEHNVRYVIIGGEAVIYYGFSRLTGDVDFFYEPSKENSEKLFAALVQFWDGDVPGIGSPGELIQPGLILQFGVPPNRIDLVNSVGGVTFPEVWENRSTEEMEISGRMFPVNFIGLEELIKNKESIGRPKDQEDLKYLKRAREYRDKRQV